MAVLTVVWPASDSIEEIVKPTGQSQSALEWPRRASAMLPAPTAITISDVAASNVKEARSND